MMHAPGRPAAGHGFFHVKHDGFWVLTFDRVGMPPMSSFPPLICVIKCWWDYLFYCLHSHSCLTDVLNMLRAPFMRFYVLCAVCSAGCLGGVVCYAVLSGALYAGSVCCRDPLVVPCESMCLGVFWPASMRAVYCLLCGHCCVEQEPIPRTKGCMLGVPMAAVFSKSLKYCAHACIFVQCPQALICRECRAGMMTCEAVRPPQALVGSAVLRKL